MSRLNKYRFGFSVEGLIGFALVMLPNIIWMIHPPADDPISANQSSIAAVNIVMSAAQWIMIAVLICIKSEEYNHNDRNIHYIAICGICLAIYYVSWILYYCGVHPAAMLVGMAVEPSIYFIVLGLWLRNYISLPPAVIFAVLHILVTMSNAI